MKKYLIFLLFSGILITLSAQRQNGYYPDRSINFPDIPGYITLKTDLHMHTVFSDGEVWPSIRVQEAVRDGLDAISVTDHIEYQPNRDDIPHPDRNRSYEITSSAARDIDSSLIVINGAEVTRNMPPGHANAIFLEDANKLNINDSIKALQEAKKQGAFIFWNHPHWEAQHPDGIATITDLHKKLFKKEMLHGIEVVNDVTYSDEALQIALEYDLTILGTSDVHGLVDWQYDVPAGGHRPITLVFAKEKTADHLKEALFEKRTVVYFNSLLIGREQYLAPLINQSIKIKKATYGTTWSGPTIIATIIIENICDAPLILKNKSEYNFHDYADVVVLEPNRMTQINVKTIDPKKDFELKFEVLNAVIAPNTHPEINIKVEVEVD